MTLLDAIRAMIGRALSSVAVGVLTGLDRVWPTPTRWDDVDCWSDDDE
jgi:hypothetical protein